VRRVLFIGMILSSPVLVANVSLFRIRVEEDARSISDHLIWSVSLILHPVITDHKKISFIV